MSVSILLPAGKLIYLTCFTNAAYQQKVTVTPPSGAVMVFQGSGEGNHVVGTQSFNTPSGSQDVTYTINIEYSSNGGASWNQSSLIPGQCVVGTMNMQIVLSEDHADNDFNDAVAQFNWWEPTS